MAPHYTQEDLIDDINAFKNVGMSLKEAEKMFVLKIIWKLNTKSVNPYIRQ